MRERERERERMLPYKFLVDFFFLKGPTFVWFYFIYAKLINIIR